MRRTIPLSVEYDLGRRNWWRFQRALRDGNYPGFCHARFSKYFIVPRKVELCTLVLTSKPDPDYYQCMFDDQRELFLLLNERTDEWEKVCATGSVDGYFRTRCKPWYTPDDIGPIFWLGVEYEMA